jgi:asparagine synthase (glutamine-hydrolysing)
MPGIAGILDPESKFDSKTLLEKMLEAMKHEEFYSTDKYVDPPIALGRIHLGVLNPEPQPIFNEDQEKCIVMSGEVYDCGLLRDRLCHGHSFRLGNDPELLLHLYEKYGLEFANLLDGSFTLAIWDAKRKKLVVANDRYGLLPLYYTNFDGSFIFAPEVKAVIKIDGFPRVLNESALGDFFSFGYILGDKTLLENVKLMPPASIFVVDGRTGSFVQRKYWDFNISVKKDAEFGDIIDMLYALLKRAVNVRADQKERMGIALSGGMDSRSILAAMDSELRGQITAFTFGVRGTLDERISRIVTQKLKVHHKFFEVPSSHLRETAEKVVYVTDGMYMFHHAYGTYILYKELKKCVDIVFTGVAAWGYLTSDILRASSQKELVAAILKSIRYVIPPSEQDKFFSGECKKARLSCTQNVEEELEKAKSTPIENRADHFFLANRVRRCINLGTVHLRTFFEVRLPLLDNALIDYYHTIDPRLRSKGRARYVLGRMLSVHAPLLSKIPVECWESPPDSSSLTIRLKLVRAFARKQLRRGLQNVSQGKLTLMDPHGIVDHNHWFRTRDARDFIEGILLDSKTLSRPYFNSKSIESMVRSHMTGRKDLADPLGTLVTFELWHRMFLDRVCSD